MLLPASLTDPQNTTASKDQQHQGHADSIDQDGPQLTFALRQGDLAERSACDASAVSAGGSA